MLEPRPVRFGAGWTELALGGVPVVEAVLDSFVGRCQECGRPAEGQVGGSVLVNLVVLGGTLYGDTFCVGCVTDDLDGPLIHLPPLPGGTSEEEEIE